MNVSARAAAGFVFVVLGATSLAGEAGAHHAFAAEFDANAPVTLKGRITKMEWINPHSWLHMEVYEPGKPPQNWMVEAGPPNTMLRAGLTRDTIKPGTEVVVRGFQALSKSCTPACKANGRDVTLADGRKLFLSSSGSGAPAVPAR